MADPPLLTIIRDPLKLFKQSGQVQMDKVDHRPVRLGKRPLVEVCAQQPACIPTNRAHQHQLGVAMMEPAAAQSPQAAPAPDACSPTSPPQAALVRLGQPRPPRTSPGTACGSHSPQLQKPALTWSDN